MLGPTFDYTHRLLDFALAAGRRRRRRRRPRRRAGEPTPRVTDLLDGEGLIERDAGSRRGRAGRRPDARAAATFRPTATCACRTWRAATRASCWRSAIRRSAAMAAPIPSPARSASARSRSSSFAEELGFAVPLGAHHASPSARWSTSSRARRRRRRSSRAATAWSSARASARRCRWRWSTARCARDELGEDVDGAGAGRGIRAVALRQRAGDRLRRAPEAAALRRLPGRARPGRASCAPSMRRARAETTDERQGGGGMNAQPQPQPATTSPISTSRPSG